jgi:type I restriction enzyme M protein
VKTAVREIGDEALLSVAEEVFGEGFELAKTHLKKLRDTSRKELDACDKREKKQLQATWDEKINTVEELLATLREAHWLYSKFGEGVYADIPGFCKIADLATVEGKGWSLTPGAYVGVAPVEDDGVDFAERMAEIHKELLTLQAESNDLMDAISKNMEEMGL